MRGFSGGRRIRKLERVQLACISSKVIARELAAKPTKGEMQLVHARTCWRCCHYGELHGGRQGGEPRTLFAKREERGNTAGSGRSDVALRTWGPIMAPDRRCMCKSRRGFCKDVRIRSSVYYSELLLLLLASSFAVLFFFAVFRFFAAPELLSLLDPRGLGESRDRAA